MGRASRTKHIWHTTSRQRAPEPIRDCGACNNCTTHSCEWRHGMLDSPAGRPDNLGVLFRQSALDPSVLSAIDIRTSGGAIFAYPDMQERLMRIALKGGRVIILLTSSMSPVGMVGAEAARAALFAKLGQMAPQQVPARLAAALIDDDLAGKVDRDALVPGQVAAEKVVRSAQAAPQHILSGSRLQPVLETIQPAS